MATDKTILGLMTTVTNPGNSEPMTDAERDQFFDTILTLLLRRKERKDQTDDIQNEGQ